MCHDGPRAQCHVGPCFHQPDEQQMTADACPTCRIKQALRHPTVDVDAQQHKFAVILRAIAGLETHGELDRRVDASCVGRHAMKGGVPAPTRAEDIVRAGREEKIWGAVPRDDIQQPSGKSDAALSVHPMDRAAHRPRGGLQPRAIGWSHVHRGGVVQAV